MMLAMGLQSSRLQGARRWWLAATLTASIAAAALALVTSDGGTAGAAAMGPVHTAGLPTFRAAIATRMRSEHLDYRWIVCLPSGNRFEGVRVVRCNVDFGEPHIVAYCSVFRGTRLLTSEDQPAIPCGHDDAGYGISIRQYG